MGPLIECSGLTKEIRGRRVVDDLGFSVEAGQVVGFLGPNGAGKTTTIRMLLGMSRVTSGSARLFGASVGRGPSVLAQVGGMVEEPAFYPWMSGRANLEVALRSGDDALPDAVPEALERAGIDHAADQKVKEYSQGMRQRLGLAAAMMRRPRALILDEPANGLDPQGIRELRELVRSLADEGAAILLSSHQLGEVEQVCDRVVIIDRGCLVAQGDTDALLKASSRIRVEVPSPQDAATSVALGLLPVERVGIGSFLVRAAAGHVVSELLSRSGIYPDTVVAERATLEERFFEATEHGGVS